MMSPKAGRETDDLGRRILEEIENIPSLETTVGSSCELGPKLQLSFRQHRTRSQNLTRNGTDNR
jgi:hypothetical protein